MKELFAVYEVALLARRRGFNEICLRIFSDGELNDYNAPDDVGEVRNSNWDDPRIITAPMYQQLVDYLFDKYELVVGMEPCGEGKWAGYVRKSGQALEDLLDGFTMYPDKERYKALDEALTEAFNLHV